MRWWLAGFSEAERARVSPDVYNTSVGGLRVGVDWCLALDFSRVFYDDTQCASSLDLSRVRISSPETTPSDESKGVSREPVVKSARRFIESLCVLTSRSPVIYPTYAQAGATCAAPSKEGPFDSTRLSRWVSWVSHFSRERARACVFRSRAGVFRTRLRAGGYRPLFPLPRSFAYFDDASALSAAARDAGPASASGKQGNQRPM